MISEEQLRQALNEHHIEALSQIPPEEECGHVFSDRFTQNMNAVLCRQTHPYRRILRMAASVAIVLLFSSTLVLTLSPTARASVMGWIFGYENNVYSYTATGEKDDSDVFYQYGLHQIPEGYTLWQEHIGHSQGFTLYAEEESGKLLQILYAPNDGTSALFLIPEDAEKQTVQLESTTADLYLSNTEDSSSSIVWTDPQTEYLISIDGFFSQEELIEFAENVTVEKIPRPEQ